MNRVDLYGTVHKGIRALFFATVERVGRTDFGDAGEARGAADELRRLFGFLTEHAAHEDEEILPELATLSPELHADLASQHARTEGLQGELAGLVERLGSATEAERLSLGRRIHERLVRLLLEHLAHMENEETYANRALWAHRGDGELKEIEGRIVRSIPPARMAEWLEFLLPAVSRPERAGLVGEMHAGAPPEVFEELTGLARAALGSPAWRAVLADAGIVVAETAGAGAGGSW